MIGKFGILYKKYKNTPDAVKASCWFVVANVLQKGISLLTTPVFTRLLTTDQYGVFSVYQSWYSIIFVFATLHLYAGVYNNGLTKWPQKRDEFTSSLLALSTTITIALFVVYLVAMDFWNSVFNLPSVLMITMFIEMLFVPAYNFWSAGQRYDYKYRKLVIISLVSAVVSPIIGIIAVQSIEYKTEARVISYVFVQVAIGLVIYIMTMMNGKCFFVKKFWKFALAFNLPLIPHYLSQTVLNQADRIMISRMIGDSEAAMYSVAYTISMMFTILTTAINSSFIPYTYKALKNKNYSSLKKNSNFLVVLVACFCLIAMAFGPEIIQLFAAHEYYAARWVVPPVAEALLFMFIYPLFCNIEFYYEKTKFIMVASASAAVMNVVLNCIFIKIFGYIAAAYTTLVCYILLSFVHYMAYVKIKKNVSISTQLYDLRLIVCLSIVSLLCMLGMTMVYDHIFIRYVAIAVLVTIAVIKRNLIISKLKEIKK